MRLLASIVILPLAALGVWGASLFGRPDASAVSKTFQAVRRTFPVILLEKGELKAATSLDIKCEVEGRSTIISLVAEGTSVKKGDLLIELASDEIEERVQKQKIDVASARATLESAKMQNEILIDQNKSDIQKVLLKVQLSELELKKYTEGDWPQQLQDAEFLVEENQKILERAKADLEAAEKLVEKNYITRTEFEDDEFAYYKAEVNLKKAKRDLEILQEYTHVKDLQQKTSDHDEAKKELQRVTKKGSAAEEEQRAKLEAREAELQLKTQRLAKLEEQMSKTKILAPADGLVVYGDGNQRWYGNDNQIKEGAQVRERQTLMQLPDTSKMMVVVRIHEAQTDKIKLGQKVTVRAEGVGNKQFTGTVTKIAVLADSQNRWLNPELKEYETEIMLDESNELLKPGVTARAEILIAELENVIAVPIQSVFNKGSKAYVFVGGDDAEPREVSLGLASTEFVEIKSGLEEHEEVLLLVSDNLKRKLPEVKRDAAEFANSKKQTPKSRGGAKRQGRRGSKRG